MEKLNKLIQAHFLEMCKSGKLFRVNISGQEIWELYLTSFKDGDDPIFRDPASSMHNCNHCKNFIRRYGNIVCIGEDYKIVSIFDVKGKDEFAPVVKALSAKIKSANIAEVFFETFNELTNLPYEKCNKNNELFRLGIDRNAKMYTAEEAALYGVVEEGETRIFNHIHLDLPKAYVNMSGASIEAIMANYRDAKNVFQRAMEEISLDTLLLVRDLINQESLLDGKTHLHKIEQIIPMKDAYDKLAVGDRDNWCWETSFNLPFAKFKNELIGVLCSELSSGEEINKACQSWNKRVDPANYMKVTAPITKKQIEEARQFVEENGYEESFNRRMATINDIKASEIMHMNVGERKAIKEVSVFDSIAPTKRSQHKRNEFDGIDEIHIDKFMTDILPNCTGVEAFLSNNHDGNLVTMTTANIPDSKPIFKWPNNYSWTFNGDLAGKSQIKQNVKAAGGKITGVLRTSLQWNDPDTPGNVDFDLHCKESKGSEIYYGNKKSGITKGWLDVDMIRPAGIGIENITWQEPLKDMVYVFFVRNFCGGRNKGFKVEIEFGGEVFNYFYQNSTGYKQDVQVATITVINGEMSIVHHLQESTSSREIYELQTNEFHKVNLVCLSPNHWDGNTIGNKHYFFMLEGCKSPTSIRGFHNENLIPELLAHRKVMDVLGAQSSISSTDKQLSGLGFNATVRDELIVKLSGNFKRVVKIKF